MRTLFPLILGLALFACDDDKKPEKTPAIAPSAVTVVPPAPATSAAPTAAGKAEKKPLVCPDGPNVVTDDPVMDGQLHIKLAKKPGETIKLSELGNVKSLDLTQSKKLATLDGCLIPKMIGLKHIFIGPGEYDDLSPIANLVHLETVRAAASKVADLKPLEKLTLLDRLDLGRTPVRDLEIVGKLVNLTELQLDNTQVSDLSPLANCKKLEKLFLKNTMIVDLNALRDLKNLKLLDIGGTQVVDVSPLGNLTSHGLKITSK